MKTLKLVLGILCIVLSAFVIFQSCAAGVANTLAENGEVSGSAGTIVAIMLLVGGVVMLATRKSEKKGGSIAAIILFGIGAIMGFANAGSFSDLKIWSVFCIVLAIINLLSILGKKKAE